MVRRAGKGGYETRGQRHQTQTVRTHQAHAVTARNGHHFVLPGLAFGADFGEPGAVNHRDFYPLCGRLKQAIAHQRRRHGNHRHIGRLRHIADRAIRLDTLNLIAVGIDWIETTPIVALKAVSERLTAKFGGIGRCANNGGRFRIETHFQLGIFLFVKRVHSQAHINH